MRATIRAVMPYELHGTRYYHIVFVSDGQARPQQARLSYDMVHPDPRPGDRVEVHAILGVVDRIVRIEDGAEKEVQP